MCTAFEDVILFQPRPALLQFERIFHSSCVCFGLLTTNTDVVELAEAIKFSGRAQKTLTGFVDFSNFTVSA